MFSGRKSVKVDKQLYEKLTEAAGQKGYSSTEEFVQHLLERAVEGTSQDDLDQQQADSPGGEQRLEGPTIEVPDDPALQCHADRTADHQSSRYGHQHIGVAPVGQGGGPTPGGGGRPAHGHHHAAAGP